MYYHNKLNYCYKSRIIFFDSVAKQKQAKYLRVKIKQRCNKLTAFLSVLLCTQTGRGSSLQLGLCACTVAG